MTAKEMFEGIGYKLSEAYSEDTLISYFDGKKNITIEFCIKNKRFRKAKGVFDCVNISIPELQAIIQQCKELGWLEDEKQETNYEHYFSDLLKVGESYGFKDGKIRHCYSMDCDGCFFYQGNCNAERFKWLASSYKKPIYRLSQFELDLLDIYKKYGTQKCIANYGTLLELNEKGHFKEVDLEAPIGEILENCEVE